MITFTGVLIKLLYTIQKGGNNVQPKAPKSNYYIIFFNRPSKIFKHHHREPVDI